MILKNKERIKLRKKQHMDQKKANAKAFDELPSFEQRIRNRAFKRAVKAYIENVGKKPNKTAMKRLRAKWLES